MLVGGGDESQSSVSQNLQALPKTLLERQSVLDALGRVGKANLKQKIRHRVGVIQQVIGNRFPDLSWVTDEAVNCRNHYVHGGKSSFNYYPCPARTGSLN